MFTALLSFLNLIPGVSNVILGITNKVFDSKVQITQAKTGADRDVAAAIVHAQEVANQQRTINLQTIAGSRVLLFLIMGFALPLIIFEWKVIVFDIVLQRGTTDPIRGQVADWATTIIGFLFGSSTIMALGSMWAQWRSRPPA